MLMALEPIVDLFGASSLQLAMADYQLIIYCGAMLAD